MSAVPLTETGAKRRIGDILLAHGFVTAEQIAEATAEQERTQQPLGQILVGHGAITRLELASALAEQWSDPAASISSAPRSAPVPVLAPAPSAQDEAQYAARLQEAVSDLARKVQSKKPLDGIDERVEELSRRIESTLARTQHIEAAVATLAESLDGVTTGVEEAFRALQTGTAELVDEMSRIDRTVGDLATRDPADDGGQALAEIAELRAAVAALTERGTSDAELRERVEELNGRLNEVADLARPIEELDGRFEGVTARLDALSDTANLDEIRGVVRELEGTAATVGALTERLDRIESEPGTEGVRGDLESQAHLLEELRIVVEELGQRPTGTPDLDERLAQFEAQFATSSLAQAELAARIDAHEALLSDEPTADPRVDDAVNRLGSVEARLDAALTEVEDVRTQLAARDESVPSGRLDALSDRVEALTRETADSRSLLVMVEELEGRLAEVVVTPEFVGGAIEDALSGHPSPVADERVAELDDAVHAVRAELAELEARIAPLASSPTNEIALADRLEALERARTADLDTVDVLARAMDRIRHDLTTPRSDDGRTDDAMAALTQLAERMTALEASVGEHPSPSPESSELAAELESFRLVLERLGLHLGEHDRALADLAPSRGLQERLDELTALVHDLAESASAPTASAGSDAKLPPSGDLGELLRRVEDAEAASQTDSEKLMNRLERMASSIDWRLQRLEADPSDDPE